MTQNSAERLRLDELGERRQALCGNPRGAGRACRKVDVITAQAHGLRRKGACTCLVIQRVRDPTPDQVLFDLVPKRCRKLKPWYSRGDWSVARDLDATKVMARRKGREPVPGLCDTVAL